MKILNSTSCEMGEALLVQQERIFKKPFFQKKNSDNTGKKIIKINSFRNLEINQRITTISWISVRTTALWCSNLPNSHPSSSPISNCAVALKNSSLGITVAVKTDDVAGSCWRGPIGLEFSLKAPFPETYHCSTALKIPWKSSLWPQLEFTHCKQPYPGALV